MLFTNIKDGEGRKEEVEEAVQEAVAEKTEEETKPEEKKLEIDPKDIHYVKFITSDYAM